ncbi:hypothetical protein ACEPAF_5974 [Sanghuangporus sanghuang]|uniref:Alpha/beta-hydrolase n=1 Tax=Sanghuangporus baumii TaxID=108892 RepID=A0A9Q5HW42_SANBA|nr:alpha/beta-hydrolase [Sanghuangporus baumii]
MNPIGYSLLSSHNEIELARLYSTQMDSKVLASSQLSSSATMPFGIPRRIDIRYDAKTVPNILTLHKITPFLDKAPIDARDGNRILEEAMFLTEWNRDSLEKKIAEFDHYLVHHEREGDEIDLHYIHVKSQRSDAILFILCQG